MSYTEKNPCVIENQESLLAFLNQPENRALIDNITDNGNGWIVRLHKERINQSIPMFIKLLSGSGKWRGEWLGYKISAFFFPSLEYQVTANIAATERVRKECSNIMVKLGYSLSWKDAVLLFNGNGNEGPARVGCILKKDVKLDSQVNNSQVNNAVQTEEAKAYSHIEKPKNVDSQNDNVDSQIEKDREPILNNEKTVINDDKVQDPIINGDKEQEEAFLKLRIHFAPKSEIQDAINFLLGKGLTHAQIAEKVGASTASVYRLSQVKKESP